MGGGGSSSGNDWPSYMKNRHETWLNDVANEITSALSKGNPIEKLSIIRPSDYFGAAIGTTVFAQLDKLDKLDIDYLWNKTYETVVTGNVFQDSVKTYMQVLKDEIDEKILPEFKAGMRNINAVQTSQFIIGESIIDSALLKKVAQYANDVQRDLIKMCDSVLKLKVQTYKDVVHYSLESSRIYLSGDSDRFDQDYKTKEDSIKWRLDMYDHGVKMLGALSGSGTGAGKSRMTKAQSALSGAAAGAGIGAMAGGPTGAAVGGVIGGIAGALTN